ncbi:secondary thiamine-phosphate synthase enzyme YjbQ [Porphyrobacter sp. GA68]|uniref:secondary thiamine-phosphate synthase enzyme YjbQ n=1 Tax=Porphyrobacter sp. GA68 TaxID=2883480 RepID=UPI001D18FB3C|nr:secondary thiamine-phosphate synthase enzyme YjbQ [Porphyrobacter sp. GA68]
MRQASTVLVFATSGPALLEITGEVAEWLTGTGVGDGLLTLLCRHTSASLLITENASGAVRGDMLRWLDRMAPRDGRYAHDDEGADDMPAHLRSALTGVHLAIPVGGGRMQLGTWQGIFLAEHRDAPHRREVAAHVIGA